MTTAVLQLAFTLDKRKSVSGTEYKISALKPFPYRNFGLATEISSISYVALYEFVILDGLSFDFTKKFPPL